MPEAGDIFPEVPDFSRWNRGRLQLLLDEYRQSLDAIRLVGTNKKDRDLYKAWIKAIEEELHRRG